MKRRLSDGRYMLDVIAEHGVRRKTFYRRIAQGWDDIAAATAPTGTRNPAARPAHLVYMADGQPALQVARSNGISDHTFRKRMSVGWDVERAATEPTRPIRYLPAPDGRPWVRHAVNNGVTRDMFYRRVYRGWTPETAATTPQQQGSNPHDR